MGVRTIISNPYVVKENKSQAIIDFKVTASNLLLYLLDTVLNISIVRLMLLIVRNKNFDLFYKFTILVLQKDGNVIKGFGISILQNKLFLTSQEPASLSAVHRFNYAEGAELLTRDLEYPYQVHVYHRVRQPDLPGKCVPRQPVPSNIQSLCWLPW